MIKKTILTLITLIMILTSCSTSPNIVKEKSNNLEVYFIDVEQGDSTFIILPNKKTILIDGGSREKSNVVTSLIKKLKIEKIDYLIATHPHEDHIGGLIEVVKNIDIESIYMPDKTSNTKVFEDLLLTIQNKGLKINKSKGMKDILIENDIEFTILGPNSSNYNNLNDFSIVNKIVYKDISLLFTGDIEAKGENELMLLNEIKNIDVLKVAHHGSRLSTKDEFLNKVSPTYGIISSGENNSYGHPHKETLERLSRKNVKVFETKKEGTIKIASDGKNLKISRIRNELENDETKDSESNFIGNKNSEVYHIKSCKSLPLERNRVYFENRSEAQDSGYRASRDCL